MPLPSYTDQSLADYMHRVLGASELGASLGWSVVNGDYDDAVDEVALTLDVDDVASISGRQAIRQLRAVARLEVWRSVASRTAGDYHFRTEAGASYDRQQVHAQALLMLQQAEAEAAALGVTAVMPPLGKTTVVHTADVYRRQDSSGHKLSRL